MFEYFKDDFRELTLNMLKTLDINILRGLRDHLSDHHVYVVKRQGLQISQALFNLIEEDEYPKWPEDVKLSANAVQQLKIMPPVTYMKDIIETRRTKMQTKNGVIFNAVKVSTSIARNISSPRRTATVEVLEQIPT